VFACFIDFSKAFDRVSYWKLFHKLLDDNVDVGIVRVLAFWYSKQQACIRWHGSLSQFFYSWKWYTARWCFVPLAVCTLYKGLAEGSCYVKDWLQYRWTFY